MNVRITAGLAVVTAMLVAGCTSDAPDESSASPAVSPLEGMWRTPAVSPRDVEATLHRHGLDPARGGPPSTVVDCTGARPVILREGAVPTARIAAILDTAGVEHDLLGQPR